TDDVGDALRVSALRAVRRSVSHAHGARRVGEQRVGKIEFLREVLVLLDGIETDAQDGGVFRGKITGSIPEPAALEGSTRRVGLRVEPEDDVLAAQVAELHRLALVGREGEIGRGVADVQHGHAFPRIRWSWSWLAMIVLDGATGTELGRRGVETRSRLFSAAALLSEEGVATLRAVHADYVSAGAQVITANTFRTNPRKAGARWRELTELAVRVARESGARVAGSMAPVEDCYRPDLRPSPDVALLEHRELAQALAAAGCDLLLVETVVAADEGLVAVRAAVETGLPVWVAALAMAN